MTKSGEGKPKRGFQNPNNALKDALNLCGEGEHGDSQH